MRKSITMTVISLALLVGGFLAVVPAEEHGRDRASSCRIVDLERCWPQDEAGGSE